MAIAVGGFISLPTWASGWNATTVPPTYRILSSQQDELLAAVVDTIIPATTIAGENSPGARTLGVHQFLQKMVNDCYEPNAQQTLTKGLTTTDALAQQTYNQPFSKCDTPQRIAVLNQISKAEDPAQSGFYQLVKGLTIRGYMSSEYVMTNLTHYQMIPGHYYGCVPVPAAATPLTQPK